MMLRRGVKYGRRRSYESALRPHDAFLSDGIHQLRLR